MQMKRILPATLFALVSIGSLNTALAQTKSDTKEVKEAKPDYEFIASVNGVAITQGLLNLNIRALVNQGQRDTPELRQAIKED